MSGRKRLEPANVAIARSLGTRIVTGEVAPGAVLPSEVELAQSRAVARSVVREALRRLAAKGLVDSRPKAGTRVRPRGEWNLLDPELLGWMFSGAPSLGFVRALFELRLVVEPAAAALAAERRSAEQLDRMAHALADMARHGLATEAGRRADEAFHTVLLAATGNELMVSLSASIAAAVRWTTIFKHRGSRPPRDALPDHQSLYAAIVARDAAAARTAAAALVRQAGLDTEAALAAAAPVTGRVGVTQARP